MQGNCRCAGGQRLAVPLHAVDGRDAEGGVLGGELRAGWLPGLTVWDRRSTVPSGVRQ